MQNKIKMKCDCQCWKCATNNHEGCESHTSICNIEFIRIMENFENEK